MDIDTYDEVKTDASEVTLASCFLPKHPFRLLMSGASSCGKTTILINMLLKDWGIKYDRLYVISPSLHQSKYQMLMARMEEGYQNRVEKERKKLNKKKGLSDAEIEEALAEIERVGYFYDTVEDFDMSVLNPENKNVVVFDDVMLEKNQSSEISLFSRGRHLNTSVIYLTQSYFKVDKNIRLNLNVKMFWSMNAGERTEIWKSVLSDIEKPVLDGWVKSLGKHEFLVVDDDPYIPEIKYRKNFNTILKPSS